MRTLLKINLYFSVFLVLSLAACQEQQTSNETAQAENTPTVEKESTLPLDKLKIPEGFELSVFAENVENARQMHYDAASNYLFVGTRKAGNVYALKDTDNDGFVDKQIVLARGLNMPNGVAMKDGDLYVAEVNRIIRYPQIATTIKADMPYEVVYDEYPSETHHGWKYIDFGPDDKLYVPVGAPCNICDTIPIFASITRLDVATKAVEIVQHGIRNTVGFTWHPVSGDLWFTDNGRDWMGDDSPDCELNVAKKDNIHFGYPYCHGGDILDPEFGASKTCDTYEKPVAKLGPHVAPLGLIFYTGEQFPNTYKNQLFIAEHGSWNRDKKIGYRIKHVNPIDSSQQVFIEGWLNDETQDVWGRPVDIEALPDGSLLISDDFADVIYRLQYKS